jgi:hypothetical protein
MDTVLSGETIVITIVGMVATFIFGSSGVATKWADYLFTSKQKREEKEQTELEAKEMEIQHLRDEVSELKMIIVKLDKDLIETTVYVKALLSYLETFLPEGANPFIAEMARELRKKGKNENI